ncbi:MAG: hypothetical protein AB7W47_03180 [Calditrichaceae bacterium]
MESRFTRLQYLFQSTKGLILLAISAISLVTAIWGTLSGPMAEWGVRDITVSLLGMDLHPIFREGRMIALYHSIAMAVIAIEVYMITSIVPMKKIYQTVVNATITVGYLMVLVFGLWFAYFGRDFLVHGLFIAGQTLVFFSGAILAVAVWPWNKEYYVCDNEYSHTKKGLDLERVAFFSMVVATLGSALFGAAAGAYWTHGHETFLAENIIRDPHHSSIELAVIGHLHIMLALIAIAITLIVGRWLDFKGIFHKIAMPLMIIGIIVITLGVWSVVPYEATAHTFIYVGSVFSMSAALMLVIFGWRKLIKDRLAEQGIEKANIFQSIAALIHDPIKFGPLWQMVFMNFTVSGVGIFLAVKLDAIFRVWPAREERITLSGHWHILSAIIATIILMYYIDISGIKGKARKWLGWLIIIGSDIAFASMTIFSFKRLIVPEIDQQGLVDTTMLLTDIGLGLVLILLSIILVWRLIDLFRNDGLWQKEAQNPELEVNMTSPSFIAETANTVSGQEVK